MNNIPRPITLIIMDGYGINPDTRGNAIAAAHKPNLDRLFANYPHTQISTSGLAVGLPEGQMGNSEVGHLNIGAGRIVYQEVTRIDKSIHDGDFFKNEVLINQIESTKARGGKLHIMGLASDGLVHSSLNHLYALLKLCGQHDMHDVVIHAFLDGRDTSPSGGVGYLEDILKNLQEIGIGRIGTVIGRYYAMDRDKRWPRTKKAYDLLVFGKGLATSDPIKAVKSYYGDEVTDEFMEPISVAGFDHLVKENDGIIFFNFRADRARQLSLAFTERDFKEFDREGGPIVREVGMTLYDVNLKVKVAFDQQRLDDLFVQITSARGIRQLRTAETEKYPHVTFFFNGGVEKPYPGEDRIMVHSPKVATYDLKPDMSAYEVTESTLKKIADDIYDVIIMNYANCDMVGHTGVFDAARRAVEAVDDCVGKISDAVRKKGGISLITADHGNAEKMLDDNGGPFTAHTIFPVPLILVDENYSGRLREGGILADLAPTMLQYLKIPQAPAMTGKSLLLNHD